MITTALITGASTGIGAEFARQLAAKKVNVVLVARSGDKLSLLAQQLHQTHGIKTDVIVQDLSVPAATKAVRQTVDDLGLTIDLLVNNAGFGEYGPFVESQLDRQTAMVQLNVTALMELTHLFLPDMVKQQRGSIINVASIGGFQPMPYWSVYAASKAFVLSFSEAVWAEVKDQGVRVLALCPGPTESEFFKVANVHSTLKLNTSMGQLESAENVVKSALKALDEGSSNLVTGNLINQMIVNLPRFLPRDMLVGVIEKQFRTP